MNKYRKGILILIVFAGAFSSHWLRSQDSGIDAQSMVSIPASPEASGLIQYGNTDVNMNLGRPNISVPLYTHQGLEMQLPILLSYDASGFKPTVLKSTAGMDWTLVAGGVVTRIRLGMADDDSNLSGSRKVNSSVIQEMIDFSHSDGLGPEQGIDNLTVRTMLLNLQKDIGNMTGDHQPDAYSFSTGSGLSGTIYVDYKNNKAYCMEDPTMKVEAVGNLISPSMWKITDATGTQYEFTVKEETKYDIEEENTGVTGATYTSAWYLTKIVSPNKKDQYTFTYSTEGYWQGQEELPEISAIQDRPSSPHCAPIFNDEVRSIISEYSINQRLLTSVNWNGKKIADFTYNDILEEVSIFYGATPIKKYNLTHSGSLTSLTLKDSSGQNSDQTWSFEYHNSSTLPGGIESVDYWGYYNGKSNLNLIPSTTWDGTFYPGADRSPVLEKTREGIMSKMYFPTGGYEEFTYELNELNSSIKQGGLRIAKIESKLADGTVVSTRTYEYEQATKLQPIRFEAVKTELKWVDDAELTCETLNRYSSNTATSVGPTTAYGKVTEKRTNGVESNGRSVYFLMSDSFTGADDVPFKFGGLFGGKLMSLEVYDENNVLLEKTENTYVSMELSSVLTGVENAKALFFTTNETVVGRRLLYYGSGTNQYYYEYIPWDNNDEDPSRCLVLGICNFGGVQSFPVYQVRNYTLNPYFLKLTKTVSTSYFGSLDSKIETETLYDYDESTHFQVKQVETIDSKGDTWYTKLTYPDDLFSTSSLYVTMTGNEQNAINKMKKGENHQINRVIQTERLKGTNSISRQRTNYVNLSGDLVLPESVETAKGSNNLEKRVEYVKYSTNGNPLEVRQVEGTSISYIWGYDNRYIVAQVQNLEYSKIENIAAFGANFTLGSGGLSLAQETALRSLTGALVTTMYYAPGIGMSRQTGPNGLSTFYEYDGLGRLKYIRDKDNNILKKIEYAYKENASNTNN